MLGTTTRFAPESIAACSTSVASSGSNPHQAALATLLFPDWTLAIASRFFISHSSWRGYTKIKEAARLSQLRRAGSFVRLLLFRLQREGLLIVKSHQREPCINVCTLWRNLVNHICHYRLIAFICGTHLGHPFVVGFDICFAF